MTKTTIDTVLALTGVLTAFAATQVSAESPLGFHPNITPDTVYHRGGQQLPIVASELKPFQNDPIAVHLDCIPPVNTRASEFTTLSSYVHIEPDQLISKGGIRF